MRTGELEGFKKSDIVVGITITTDVSSEKILHVVLWPIRFFLFSVLPMLMLIMQMLLQLFAGCMAVVGILLIIAFILLLLDISFIPIPFETLVHEIRLLLR